MDCSRVGIHPWLWWWWWWGREGGGREETVFHSLQILTAFPYALKQVHTHTPIRTVGGARVASKGEDIGTEGRLVETRGR